MLNGNLGHFTYVILFFFIISPRHFTEISNSKALCVLRYLIFISFLQEFLSESENGQHKLNTMLFKGELLSSLLTEEKAQAVQAKVLTAKEEWKSFHANLHQKESALEVLPSHPMGHALWSVVVVVVGNGQFQCPTEFLSILVTSFCIETGNQMMRGKLGAVSD